MLYALARNRVWFPGRTRFAPPRRRGVLPREVDRDECEGGMVLKGDMESTQERFDARILLTLDGATRFCFSDADGPSEDRSASRIRVEAKHRRARDAGDDSFGFLIEFENDRGAPSNMVTFTLDGLTAAELGAF